MTQSTPIVRRSLHDELLGRIRALIVDGELEPGSRVPERALCDLFHVSRTPLREALKVLAAEGLIELHPHRGAIVAGINIADVEEGFPVMAALEALSGELACQNITDAEVNRIREMHEVLREAHKNHDRTTYFRVNVQIHLAILDASRNDLLGMHYSQVSTRVRRARMAAKYTTEQWDRAMSEHEDIMELLEKRDARKLSEVLHAHILGLMSYYQDILKKGGQAGTAA